MFTTSKWSDVSPSPFGSAASSSASAMIADDVDPRANTLIAKILAPGATPWGTAPAPMPAAIPETWDPCPPRSSGSGSGIGMLLQVPGTGGTGGHPALYHSPTRSVPPNTFAVGNVPGSTNVGLFAAYSAGLPLPPRSACV